MTTPAVSTPTAASTPTGMTRRLLIGGAGAVALFIVASLLQAALRPGYNLTRHPVSVLANGAFGWIQSTVFLAAALLTLGYAAGVHRRTGGRLVPALLAVQGAGLIVAGLFRMDPVDGFPIGTPAGTPDTFTTDAVVHNIGSSLSFLALAAACLVLAHRFAAAGHRRWAWAGRLSTAVFAAGVAWAMSGGRAGALTLFLGVVVAWTWMAATAIRLARPADLLEDESAQGHDRAV